MTERETTEAIVALEWEMFHAINRPEARAACQNDRPTFHTMRAAQFSAWDQATRESYLRDLTRAKADGRNLPEEKYIRMMAYTFPAEYPAAAERLGPASERRHQLAAAVNDMLVQQAEALRQAYPAVGAAGRPLYSADDTSLCTSLETYQLCELQTYSEATLQALLDWIRTLEKEGVSLAERILTNTVQAYGYKTIGEAEAQRRR